MSSLIRTLSSPGQEARIASRWAGGPGDLRSRLGWLREHGMLFEEDGKLLSLVLSGDDEELQDVDITPGLHRLLSVEAAR
jgi:hypothetical protein